ncbi:N-acetylneuraminate synthase [Halomarina oriensis]|uniref:N-acetylneuraminate synthase n=1 Tax=Halomarina oriensis TaxID=671145 RepID=A0A6B0GVZ6_9EURY|nr:N-acetylneuraminate synthase [Halomarina oriensis]MWG36315.1 N-acetylneuraminate synthase [Halomarina oriensis]
MTCYFIAEAGVNHDGDMDRAERLVDAAVAAGADAVKFQTFVADRLATRDAPKAPYQEETTGEESQHEMLQSLELTRADHDRLQSYCRERGIDFLSTPFDVESATLLDELDVPRVKLGSGELDNHPLLEHVAGFGRPMVVSTGMGTMEEVEAALAAIRGVDEDVPVTFLHCTTAYPAALDEVNLRAMRTMADTLPVPVGYSDHTTRVEVPAFAVAAGATVVEKHFTLDRTLSGPDHRASLEPDELTAAVALVRDAETVLGSAEKGPTRTERENRDVIRKALHAAVPIDAGERFTAENVAITRPADGLAPTTYERVLGTTARVALDAGNPITEESVGEPSGD